MDPKISNQYQIAVSDFSAAIWFATRGRFRPPPPALKATCYGHYSPGRCRLKTGLRILTVSAQATIPRPLDLFHSGKLNLQFVALANVKKRVRA